jgi:hypothetical protein
MMKHKWSTVALGKNGMAYRFMLFGLPVIPVSLLVFAWFILSGHPPFPIILFVVFVLLVLSHQVLEVVNFLRVAAVTAREVYIDNGGIFLQLFSGRVVSLNSNAIIANIDLSKIKSSQKLFPENMKHLSIVNDEESFYISGTTEKFDDMYKELSELIENKSHKNN